MRTCSFRTRSDSGILLYPQPGKMPLVRRQNSCDMHHFGTVSWVLLCACGTAVRIQHRNVSLHAFITLLNCDENCDISPELSFSRRQHQILTYILQQKSCYSIAQEMHISLKTYYCHKYNIMLLLKLRKMSDLVRHQISCYL